MSVIEEFGGGERVKSLFLLSENRLLTRGLPMDHGSGVYGSVGGKPEEEEEINRNTVKASDSTMPNMEYNAKMWKKKMQRSGECSFKSLKAAKDNRNHRSDPRVR